MHKANRKRNKEIAALKKMKDSEIDTSDIRETTDWSGATVGRFFRPIKEPVTSRIDADVLNWLKSKGKGYQTRINQLSPCRDAAKQGQKMRVRHPWIEGPFREIVSNDFD